MNEIIITDDKIIHFNMGTKDNEESSIVYKENGELHWIVLNRCVENYQSLHDQSSRCVAERNNLDFTITFFTSGFLTKIVFKKRFYHNFFYKKLLCGKRVARFHKLLDLISRCGFTTYDLSDNMIKIDKDKNLIFYKSYTPCDCADCRNFCKQIKSACNDLTDFFFQKNIDIEKPFELVSIDSDDTIEYVSCQYLVFGECSDDFEMNFSNAKLKKELDGHPSTKGYGEPNFVLDFSITLPKIIKD